MRKLTPLIIISGIILSLLVIAQEQDKFSQSDSQTWNDNNINRVDFSAVTKQQLDKADSALLEKKATAEQAKQYFNGRYPITAASTNELILYKKIYPNIDTSSLQGIDKLKLGEGSIETPVAKVDFGNSNAKVAFDQKKGLMVNGFQVSGEVKIHDKDHFTLGPKTLITTPNNVLVYVKDPTEFYAVGNSCTGSVSCVESDTNNRYLRGIARDGNIISVKADNEFSMYDKIQLFKDRDSKLWLWENKGGSIYGPQVIFRERADGPVSIGVLPFKADVEIGQIGSKTLLLSKEGGAIREGTPYGKVFEGGNLNKVLRENIGVYITPDTTVVDKYRTTDDFEVYRTTSSKGVKNEIFIFDSKNKELGAIYYADGELFNLGKPKAQLGPDGSPLLNPDGSLKTTPVQQRLNINQLGPKSRQTLQEAISGKPTNTIPSSGTPTLNQPGIRHRCPEISPGVRLRCG